jgi:hypothetical protein
MEELLAAVTAELRFAYIDREVLATWKSGKSMWIRSPAFQDWLLLEFKIWFGVACNGVDMDWMVSAIERNARVQITSRQIASPSGALTPRRGPQRAIGGPPLTLGVERRLRISPRREDGPSNRIFCAEQCRRAKRPRP